MILSVGRLLKGKPEVTWLERRDTVDWALGLMIEMDYSQLPVLDEQGKLLGIVSEQSISRSLFHTDGKISLPPLSIDHCLRQVPVLSPHADVREAMEVLQHEYALVVVDDMRPIGILTNYDMTKFFRELYESNMIVHKIENMLRAYITKAFPNSESMDAALIAAIGTDKGNAAKPAKSFHELNFSQYKSMIVCGANWERFENDFSPKEYFQQMMDQVAAIRNDIAHFRGKVLPVEHDGLLRALHWMETRPSAHLLPPTEIIGDEDDDELELTAE